MVLPSVRDPLKKESKMARVLAAVLFVVMLLFAPSTAKAEEVSAKAIAAAREKGLDWLTKNQAANGSWGKTHSIAVTSFACLAYLSAAEEPFVDDRGKALVKGLNYII